MKKDISHLCIKPDDRIKNAIASIDSDEAKIAIVVDTERRLIDTITDGDIRRALLAGLDLNATVDVLRHRKADGPYPEPISASENTETAELLRLMEAQSIRQLPIIDDDRKLVGLVTLRDLIRSESLPIQGIVMAGGFGTRLRPLTDNMPKTMLTVGAKPLLESIIKRLRDSGIRRLHLTTHYKGKMISEYFGNGEAFGVDIHYIEEDQPLGTAGAVGLVDAFDEPVLVINGDILTQVDFRAMIDFHCDHQADITMGVRSYEHQVPYGVIESDGIFLRQIFEKPVIKKFVNAGIYLLNPNACRAIPSNEFFNMTDLIERQLTEKKKVVCFPIREYWLDIGQLEDYEKAQKDYDNHFQEE